MRSTSKRTKLWESQFMADLTCNWEHQGFSPVETLVVIELVLVILRLYNFKNISHMGPIANEYVKEKEKKNTAILCTYKLWDIIRDYGWLLTKQYTYIK